MSKIFLILIVLQATPEKVITFEMNSMEACEEQAKKYNNIYDPRAYRIMYHSYKADCIEGVKEVEKENIEIKRKE